MSQVIDPNILAQTRVNYNVLVGLKSNKKITPTLREL